MLKRALYFLLVTSIFLPGLLRLEASRKPDLKFDDWGKSHYERDQGFVLHEWGVFELKEKRNNFSFKNGPDPLPEFVAKTGQIFRPNKHAEIKKTGRNPIINLYGEDGLEFNMAIFPNLGTPNFSWPKSQVMESQNIDWDRMKPVGLDKDTREILKNGQTEMAQINPGMSLMIGQMPGMLWKGIKITKVLNADLKTADADSWFSKIRDTQAAGIQNGETQEKFLFYEPYFVRSFDTFSCASDSNSTSLKLCALYAPLDTMLLKVSKGEILIAYDEILELQDPDTQPWVKGKSWGEAQWDVDWEKSAESITQDDCRKKFLGILEKAGLYSREAKIMADLWCEELFAKEGVRFIYRMDQEEYDKAFPLLMSKVPDSTKRVGIVYSNLESSD